MRIAILTISDACSRGERADGSGDAIAAWAAEHGFILADRVLVPDETGRIAAALATWADGDLADLILTHRFPFDRAQDAFDAFAARQGVKVALVPC